MNSTDKSTARQLSPEEQTALKDARDMARMAYDKASRLEDEVKRAENAATDAANSARKNQKLFELQQKK